MGRIALGLGVLLWHAAVAQTVSLQGYIEGGLVYTPAERGWMDGGLGNLPWGGTGASSRVEGVLSSLVLVPRVSLPGGVNVMADLRYDTQQKSAVDVLDAVMVWTPPEVGAWHAAVKLGAFFPPFGLENRDVGWTSPYTLTSSALSSWVGEELRIVGGQVEVGWRGGVHQVQVVGAVFGWNDPAGVILANRGWVLGGRPLGLFGQLRVPDATVRGFGGVPPQYTPEFREIDGRPGYYAGASWDWGGVGRGQVYRYDNLGDAAAASRGVVGWYTRFWEAGLTTVWGPFSAIAEGVRGATFVDPSGNAASRTGFYAAYLLGAWTFGDWRTSLRLEGFGTDGFLSEHGRAVTASVMCNPVDWLRLTGEVVAIQSVRSERSRQGLRPKSSVAEPQLSMRVSF